MRRILGVPVATIGAALLAVLAPVGLTGCASAPGRAVPVAATYNIPYNLTDVLFSREMILHFRQTIGLARLVPGRAEDPYVTNLAAEIIRAETPQIDVMAATLRAWEFAVPDDDKPPVHQMEGMLSPAQLLLLKGRSGPAFDRLWLTTVARHMNYGVLLADKARVEGKDQRTRDLAAEVAVAQRATIAGIVKHLS